MKLCGALVFLLMTLSAVDGLRCFTCTATEAHSCTDTKSCPVIFNRCFSLKVDGYDIMTKGCQSSMACGGAMECCEGELCNSSTHSGPDTILLLWSTGLILLLNVKI